MTVYGRDPRLQRRIDEWRALRDIEVKRIKAIPSLSFDKKVKLLRTWEEEHDFIKYVRPREFA